jgi:hypothetical protein
MKQNRQKLLLENPETSTSSQTSQFYRDLCEMLISANVPLNKVSNKQFINCMGKYTNRSLPTESTLRKNYLSSFYEDAVRRVRNIIGDNKIWVSMDESTDVDSRCVANVIAGTLFADRPGNIFLLHSEVLYKVSHTTISIIFDSAMKMLWKDEVKRDRILFFVADAAPYMLKAAKGLKMLYPRIVHSTCLAHVLHRASEEIRRSCPEADIDFQRQEDISEGFTKSREIQTIGTITVSSTQAGINMLVNVARCCDVLL